ncbi:CpaF family protein [uncultured Eubacterium sp.]|jgi:pilus assembly protein CpaF|uniref:CpaF family protein n=1 Tax=uncultured Eubacterium sp. TaxID=165185 RepID=UPI000E804F65|nr:CpaF family protein [uncultured Eubacterium sp.]HAH19184.1 type II secretion system protein E [Eubacterium sp.]HAV90981.1 type II secretion system protein E [Eubacterium sp.]
MGLLDRIQDQSSVLVDPNAKDSDETQVKVDPYAKQKNMIHSRVIDKLNRQGKSDVDRVEMLQLLEETIAEDVFDIPRMERPKMAIELLNDILGYGPIQELVDNPSYSEIMVNGPNQVYVEYKGKLTLTDIKFRDDAHLMNIIDRIVSLVGRHVDEASPMCDARLKDGSRVNVIIPPISLVGPVLTIRKFGKDPVTAQQLLEWGSMTPKMLNFLEACVKGKLNIIVSGGTGSGKTTLLNVLSTYIPADERIVTIEDAAEVQLKQEHVVTLEARPANLEGRGQVSIRDLVRNALRMRPDRIIVGECRGGETLDMLQAMNTGHDGSLTTAHANSPRDTVARVETMVMMSGMELPVRAIREQVASAIDMIVQQSRLRDGTRKITQITEVVGMEGDVISTQDLFVFETDGKLDTNGKFQGKFVATGIHPNCLQKIRENGVVVKNDWFTN